MNNYKRNYLLLFADSILFYNAMTFISINAVITYFLNNLGATTIQISLASALVSIGNFIGQPVFGKMSSQLKLKRDIFVKILLIQRFLFLAFVISIPIFAVSNPERTIVLFLVSWGIFNFFTGSYQPFYVSIMTKMIPQEKRGRLIGYSGAVGNIIALSAAFFVGMILKHVRFPYNYTYIFGIGVIILLIDAVDFLFIKEPPDKTVLENISYIKYIMNIPNVLKENKNIKKLILGNTFVVISNVVIIYCTLYAIRMYNAGSQQIAIFTALTVVMNILGLPIFGVIADHFGYRVVMLISSICGMLSGIVILLMPSIYSVYVAFSFGNISASAYNLSCSMYIVQDSPQDKIPLNVSTNFMITLIASSFSMLVCGYITDNISFTPVFIFTSVAGLAAYAVFHSEGRLSKR